MKKIVKNTLIIGILLAGASWGFEANASSFLRNTDSKKELSYEEEIKKEEREAKEEEARFEKELEDSYDEDAKTQEELNEFNKRYEDAKVGPSENRDDAGYDGNNMDKVREADHRAWDKMHDKMDLPNTEE